jgi:hypothetical protein
MIIQPKEMKLIKIDHHRNGISGNPFYIVHFEHLVQEQWHNMIAVVFDEMPECVAVFEYDLLKSGETRFPYNSWRGDVFEPILRGWIEDDLNGNISEEI